MSADATVLYNAGTAALRDGRLGEAVAFLAAARRIEPRADDIERNLLLAEGRAALGRGEEHPRALAPPGAALSPAEAWWLAAALVAAAAASGAARALAPRAVSGRARGGAAHAAAWTLLVLGLALAGWRTAIAVEERAHPEAVVVAPLLEARRGPDEPSRPPVLLRAGERVRLGRGDGGEVEVRLGGSAIGWVSREGLWRVDEAPRYTAGFQPR